ncbi:MAG TPA: AAA family ATPase [Rhizomicrobium sp.]
MLIVFAGLPGTGKSTLAAAYARETAAVYLRIDAIEQAIRDAGGDVGPAGYMVGYALAGSNLRLGRTVVADSVNPIAPTRDAWRAVAMQAGAAVAEIEVVCSDPAEHRRRVETRTVDVPGLVPPSWREVMAHEYAPFDRDRLVIDTARLSRAAALAEIRRYVAAPQAH